MTDPDLDLDADFTETRRRLQEIGAQARRNSERARMLAERLALGHLARLTVRTIADAQHGAMKRLAQHGASQFGADSDIARSLYRDAEAGYPSTTHTVE